MCFCHDAFLISSPCAEDLRFSKIRLSPRYFLGRGRATLAEFTEHLIEHQQGGPRSRYDEKDPNHENDRTIATSALSLRALRFELPAEDLEQLFWSCFFGFGFF